MIFNSIPSIPRLARILRFNCRNNEKRNIGLGRTSNHILHITKMSRGINHRKSKIQSLEFPLGNINSDPPLSLRLQCIKQVSKRAVILHVIIFNAFLLTSRNSTNFVKEVTGGGRFTNIDRTMDNKSDMRLDGGIHSFCFLRNKTITREEREQKKQRKREGWGRNERNYPILVGCFPD